MTDKLDADDLTAVYLLGRADGRAAARVERHPVLAAYRRPAPAFYGGTYFAYCSPDTDPGLLSPDWEPVYTLTKETNPMIWPFTEIAKLKADIATCYATIKALEHDRGHTAQKHVADISLLNARLKDRIAAAEKLQLQVDELRSQVHTATKLQAKAEGQLAEASKNDTKDAKGRYTKAKPKKEG